MRMVPVVLILSGALHKSRRKYINLMMYKVVLNKIADAPAGVFHHYKRRAEKQWLRGSRRYSVDVTIK